MILNICLVLFCICACGLLFYVGSLSAEKKELEAIKKWIRQENCRRYYQKHKTKIKEYRKIYYLKNREKIRKQQKEYYRRKNESKRTN